MTKKHPSKSRILVQLLGHLIAVLLMATAFLATFMNETLWGLLFSGMQDAQIARNVVIEGLLITGLAACFWAMFFIAYRYMMEAVKSRKRLAVVKTRGTVITETLIVFPVFLLLTFGLAQMAVTSMAGLLTTLATYQAARTLAVWAPERGHNRTGTTTTTDHINERAKIAAALVITPVASSLTSTALCGKSPTFGRMLAGLQDAGLSPVVIPRTKNANFSESLGTQRFMFRGPAQFASAYCSTTVTTSGPIVTDMNSSQRNQFETTVTYDHRISFPFMGPIFGEPRGAGYAKPTIRTYRMTQFLSPNPVLPKVNDIL